MDYWDDQGWKDPFSSHLFTTRQSDYVDRLRVDRGPYTPQMVIDGSEAFVGSDRAQAGRAVGKALKEAKVKGEDVIGIIDQYIEASGGAPVMRDPVTRERLGGERRKVAAKAR